MAEMNQIQKQINTGHAMKVGRKWKRRIVF
jgi:hypothetical protein